MFLTKGEVITILGSLLCCQNSFSPARKLHLMFSLNPFCRTRKGQEDGGGTRISWLRPSLALAAPTVGFPAFCPISANSHQGWTDCSSPGRSFPQPYLDTMGINLGPSACQADCSTTELGPANSNGQNWTNNTLGEL